LSRYMDIRSRSQGKASVRGARLGCTATVVFAVLVAVPVQAWGAELSLTSVTESVSVPAPTPPPPPPAPISETTSSLVPLQPPIPQTTTSLVRPPPIPKTTTTVKVTTQTQSAPSSPTAPSTQLAGSSPATSESGSGGRGSAPGPRSSGPRSNDRAAASAVRPSRPPRRVSQLADAQARSHSVGVTARRPEGWLSGPPTLSGLRLADAALEAPPYQETPSQQSSGQWEPWPSGANLRGILAAAGSSLPGTLVLLAAALIVGLLFADELGWGPRHSAWRARYLRRPPR